MFNTFHEGRGPRRFVREAFGGGWGEGAEGMGHGDGRRWHRGGGRPFDHGELRLVVLALVAERPRHGYEIIKAIEERFGGSYSPSPGVVYPTLTMLEELGHTTVEEIGGKKLYTVTEEGKAFLEANKAATERAMGRMQGERGAASFGQMLQVMRAMANFKMALKLKQRSGPLTEEQLKNIIAAIDAAAVAIERS